ncbi:MAG: hypothetical protein M3R36_07020, partial [Bacteroidota bacterium]|nr:hypothetical protein [Bacteroidota bacterium]
IAVSGSDIYAGGYFTTIGGQARNYIAKLNNTNGNADAIWNPNPNGFFIHSIAVSGSDIYAGGRFSGIGGQPRNRIAKLNNTNGSANATWNPNADGEVFEIVVSGSDIYAGGDFRTIGGQARNHIAKLNNTNGNADAAWNPDANERVYSIAVSGSDVYIGGIFNVIGGLTRKRIARIDNIEGTPDADWNPNANFTVFSIAVSGSDVYIGGSFITIGAVTRNSIAKLNNTNGNADAAWNPNAQGLLYNTVLSIAVSGSDVYAGGDFTTIGGQTRNRIAKLNNTNGNADATWNPNANGTVPSITVSGSDVYVGGGFTIIGGQTRNNIAKLNNTNGNADATWNPNASNLVYSIVVSDSDVYAGGLFTTIGGQTRNYIAKLNNTNGNADAAWNPNPNANSIVQSIAVNGSNIYAVGDFTTIGGQTRNRIAKLNNTNGNADVWNPNANYRVWSIAVSGNDVYAGGEFSTMGGNLQPYLAKFSLAQPPTTLNLKCYLEGFYHTPVHRMNKPIPVTVLLRTAAPPYNVISTDSTMLDVIGNASGISLSIPSNGNYYIVVKSWNIIETWSASPQSFKIDSTTNYDFSTSFSQAYGNNLTPIDFDFSQATRFGLYAGDITQNMAVDPSDLQFAYNDAYNYRSGNVVTDLTGDEIIDVDDLLIIDNNVSNSITTIRP